MSLFDKPKFRPARARKSVKLVKVTWICVVLFTAMMNELLKIQQDMGSPQQQQRSQQAAVPDEDEAGTIADPNDWIANLPKFNIYHRGYTTNHWLQVFRSL